MSKRQAITIDFVKVWVPFLIGFATIFVQVGILTQKVDTSIDQQLKISLQVEDNTKEMSQIQIVEAEHDVKIVSLQSEIAPLLASMSLSK